MADTAEEKINGVLRFQMIKQAEEYKRRCKESGMFTMFNLDYYNLLLTHNKDLSNKELKERLNGVIEMDYDCVLPLDVAVELNSLLCSDEFVIGTHHSSSISNNIFENEFSYKCAKDIVTGGLINGGHNGFSTAVKMPEKSGLSLNIRFYDRSQTAFFRNLKSSYKGSKGIFIFAFPREFVDKEGNIKPGCFDEIYYYNGNMPVVRPEYIYGFLDRTGEIAQFYYRDEMLEMFESREKGM